MELSKGYKQTEVGVIPEDWEVKKIGEITLSTAGGTPSTLIDEYWGGSIKWMSSGELHQKRVYDVEGRITDNGLKNSSTRIIPENCVLIGLAGQGKTRGTVAINKVELCTNQSIAAIFPSDIFDPDYLFFNLDSRYTELRNQSTGDGGRGGLNLTIINSLSVPLPPISEQRTIATALSDADALLTALDALIAKKRLVKQGAMQELLTGKRRLPGFSGEWEVKKLGDIADIKDGTHQTPEYVDYGIPFFSVENITNNEFANTKFISEEEHNVLKKNYKIENGDILMTRIGSIGNCKLIDWDVNASFYVSLALLKIKNAVSPEFIYQYSKGDSFQKEAEKNSLQWAVPKKINLGAISKIRICIPALIEEQQAIAEILSDMDAEIAALEQKREKTRLLKQGMMQELLTGRIRLI
jgi:type I restriction enzyme S subunit